MWARMRAVVEGGGEDGVVGDEGWRGWEGWRGETFGVLLLDVDCSTGRFIGVESASKSPRRGNVAESFIQFVGPSSSEMSDSINYQSSQ